MRVDITFLAHESIDDAQTQRTRALPSHMNDKAIPATGRVIRVTTNCAERDIVAGALWALAVGDDEGALARFRDAFPDLDAEIVGNLSEYSLKDLGLTKPGLMVPLS